MEQEMSMTSQITMQYNATGCDGIKCLALEGCFINSKKTEYFVTIVFNKSRI